MPVIIASNLPRLIVNSSGKYKYVFTYKNRWDKETQRSTRGKGDTTCVGKFIPDAQKADYGEICFNEDFKAKYPGLYHLRVFRHKGGKLEFRAIDEDKDNVVKPGCITKLHGGATWALNQIVGSTPLGRALRETFPEYKMHLRLLSLAYFLVIARDSSLCNFEEFAECTWLPYGRTLTSGSISRLLQRITKDKIAKFLTFLNEENRKQQGEELEEKRYWALDSTSITSYSENIASVEYGHNKDLIEAPQTNVLLIVDQQTGALIHYRNFDGNVPDVSTIRNTLSELALMKINTENVIIVTDRGYGSSANWDDMLRSNVSFVSNARRNINSSIREIIDEHYLELLDWNNCVSFINQNAVTVPIQWSYDSFPVVNKRSQKKEKKTLYIHLYYSQEINDEMTRRLRSQLSEALALQKANQAKLSDGQTKLIKRYTEEKDGKARISMAKVDETLRYAGVRVLVSDAIDDALQCCVAYEERNQVEYAFNTLKARLECNRTQVHSTQSWEGKLFLQMLAMAINGMVRSRVKLYNQNAKKDKATYRVHYDSDRKLLAKLNNVYMTQFDNGFMFDEIAGKKKELFNILNVPVPNVEQVIGVQEEQEDPRDQEAFQDIEATVGIDTMEDL